MDSGLFSSSWVKKNSLRNTSYREANTIRRTFQKSIFDMEATNSELLVSSEPKVYRDTKFFLFTILVGPSILISIYILYQFCRYRQHRSRLSNHCIIALIVVSLMDTTIEMPIVLHYLRLGRVEPMKNGYCLFWYWLCYSVLTVNIFLMAWTCIERHILIFHSNWIQTQSGKWIWHYIPLILCSTYTPLFYLSCIIIYQCENNFDYTSLLCGSICYTEVKWLLTFDWMANVLVPSLLIPLASISLLIRVMVQAKKMRRSVNWRSTKKMTIQLMMISLLYLIFSVPLAIISLIRIYFISNLLDEFTYYFLYYAAYMIQLLIPVVCFMCLPEMWPKRDGVDIALTAQRALVSIIGGSIY